MRPTEFQNKHFISLKYLPGMEDIRFPFTKETPKNLWIVLIICHILFVGLFIYYVANFVNTKFIHTYDLPVNSPGVLLTTRSSLYYWFSVFVISFDILFISICSARVAYFWNSFLGSLHSISGVLAILGHIALLILMGFYISTANSKNDPLNPANDDRYCNANSAPNDYINTLPGCPTPTVAYPLVISQAELSWNNVFRTHFWLSIIKLILVLISTIVSTYIGSNLVEYFSTIQYDVDQDVYLVFPGDKDQQTNYEEKNHSYQSVNGDNHVSQTPSQIQQSHQNRLQAHNNTLANLNYTVPQTQFITLPSSAVPYQHMRKS